MNRILHSLLLIYTGVALYDIWTQSKVELSTLVTDRMIETRTWADLS